MPAGLTRVSFKVLDAPSGLKQSCQLSRFRRVTRAFACFHTLSRHTSNFSRQKKSDFGPRRVRSFSNSPTVDSAKERICNLFTPGAEELKRRAKESQAPPIHPLLNLCVVHMGCDALHRWFRRWVYFLRSTRAYRARKLKYTQKYKLGWTDLSLWKRYDTGIKGVITFIVKVITPGMRWCLNINVLHVEASNSVWEVP